ncbi:MAG: phosphotransferase [Paraglaciecola polaris]|uniref:phosphotransferase n=1 Tax=Paraglaciecola polaris TaxID=222814 RepID=UPI003002CB5E
MPHRHQLNPAALAELVGLDYCHEGFSLEQIQKGGAVNTSYCLSTAHQRLFLKTFESDLINQLDRKQLFDVQNVIWRQGMACEPVYLSNTHAFQLDAWVESKTLANSGLSDKQQITQLADALVQIHALAVNGPTLDLPSQWAKYLRHLPQPSITAEYKLARTLARHWYDTPTNDLVFCHNDLSLQHVTVQTPRIIFDWEYCALSNRYFDIAACIEVNGLSDWQHNILLAHYAKNSHISIEVLADKVQEMLPLVNLTSRLWYRCAEEI